MVEYYTKLKVLWDELDDHDDISECTYAAATKYVKKEVEKIHQFLMGLNVETYGNVCSQILNLEPLPPLSKVYSMIT